MCTFAMFNNGTSLIEVVLTGFLNFTGDGSDYCNKGMTEVTTDTTDRKNGVLGGDKKFITIIWEGASPLPRHHP